MAGPLDINDSGVPRNASAELEKLYSDAMHRLQRIVLNPEGMTESSREFRQARAAQISQQVDGLLLVLEASTTSWIREHLPPIAAEAIQRADRQAIAAGIRPTPDQQPLRGSFSVVDRRTVELFARDIAADTAKARSSMRDRANKILRQTAQIGLSSAQLDRILAGGVIEGTPQRTIRTLREKLRALHGDQITIIDKNGDPINFKVGNYAQLVVRTKTREATVTARHQRLEELGLDLVMIIGRVSNNFCTAFLGQVFSLSGKHPKYPAFSTLPGGGPPFHPNCSKSTRPWVEELVGASERRKAETLKDVKQLLSTNPSEAQRMFRSSGMKKQIEDRYGRPRQKEVIGASG